MKSHLYFLSSLFSMFLWGQAPDISWQKSLGGSGYDEIRSIQPTSDGGFILAGFSDSNDGDVSANHGGNDYWVVKLDDTGNITWQKSLGGSNDDFAYSIQLTADGGYVVAGQSASNDGDVSGNNGGNDYWVVKLDSTGNIVWQKSLGGSNDEVGSFIQITTDGSYIITGHSNSNDGDVSGNHGSYDYWVVKLDSTGNIVWQKSLGGSNNEESYSCIQPTSDGGYIFAGSSISNDGDVSGNHGYNDYWVVKLDDSGNIVWQKSLGGSTQDEAHSVQLTSDGGYIVTGYTTSNDGDVSGNNGGWDFWVIKLDSSGNIVWQKSLGGSSYEYADFIKPMSSSDYIVVGSSYSNDGDVSGNHGLYDYWVVRFNSTGNLVWQKSMGGSSQEFGNFIQPTTDGGYIVAGSSGSNDGEVSGNHGHSDGWLVKLSPDLGLKELNLSTVAVFPNPVTNDFTVNTGQQVMEKIKVYNISGQLILESSKNSVPISSLKTGVYFLQIILSNQTIVNKKLIKK